MIFLPKHKGYDFIQEFVKEHNCREVGSITRNDGRIIKLLDLESSCQEVYNSQNKSLILTITKIFERMKKTYLGLSKKLMIESKRMLDEIDIYYQEPDNDVPGSDIRNYVRSQYKIDV